MKSYQSTIKLGLIWAGISIATTLLLYLLGMMENVMAAILIFCFGIYIMYRAGIEKREELGGFISWKLALTPIWLCAVVSSFFTSFFSWILVKFIDPGLQEKQREQAIKMIESMRSWMGDAAAEEQLAQIETQNFATFSNYIMMFFWAMIIYFIIACIIAAVVKKNDPKELFSKY
ncbi:MAG: DUF4199 domain-containing protein [Saprospiraceae bacterium]|jgi:ABC-type antimicrobial peptide transport system permease subunit